MAIGKYRNYVAATTFPAVRVSIQSHVNSISDSCSNDTTVSASKTKSLIFISLHFPLALEVL